MNVYSVRQSLKTMSIHDLQIRVVYYARVSTEKEEQKNSIKNQKKFFEDLIKKNKKWQYCGGYIDDGITGIVTTKREEFNRMISDAKSGKFDLIVTKEISRFARDTLASIKYTRELLSEGVCVWFLNDNINTIDEDSEFRLTIMAGVAQDEVRKLSSRVKFGHAQSIKNGVVLGNSRIYGYNKEKGKLTINEEEAEMVRLIFTKYATGEWSTPKLEELIFNLGYRNYKGGKISRGVIQHIITNPKYKGWYVGGKVKIVDMFTKKQEFIPESEWHMFEDDGTRVPAIVDSKTWELANKYFKERSNMVKTRRTSYKNDNLFTGKIICANDGAKYWMKQHSIRGNEDVRWVCSHRIKNGADSCSSFGLAESELKHMLVSIIKSSIVDMDRVISQYVEMLQKIIFESSNSNEVQIERLNKQVTDIKKKKDKILDYSLNGIITDEEFKVRNIEFNSQIEKLEAEISELQADIDKDTLGSDLTQLCEMIKKYANITEDDITKSVVDNMIDHISVEATGSYTANIKFHLKNGETIHDIYDKKMSCSGHMFLIVLSEQHTSFYRNLRSFDGHILPVSYNYSLVI